MRFIQIKVYAEHVNSGATASPQRVPFGTLIMAMRILIKPALVKWHILQG